MIVNESPGCGGILVNVKVNVSIKRETVGPFIYNSTLFSVPTIPEEILKQSGNKISYIYMCSTPSLPSVTSWFTSFTNTSS